MLTVNLFCWFTFTNCNQNLYYHGGDYTSCLSTEMLNATDVSSLCDTLLKTQICVTLRTFLDLIITLVVSDTILIIQISVSIYLKDILRFDNLLILTPRYSLFADMVLKWFLQYFLLSFNSYVSGCKAEVTM